MDSTKEKIDMLTEHAEAYIKTQQQLGKLIITQKTGELFSSVVSALILFAIFFFVIVFASLALAWGISSWFENMYAGFIAVTALYLLTGIILSVKRDRLLKTPLQNMFIRSSLKNDAHE